MTSHRYPRRTIMSDYLRAGIGAGLTLAPLSAVPIISVAGSILSLLGVLFVFFAARTWIRARTVVQLSDEGLAMTALRYKTVPWRNVASLDVRYFATKRDRSQGWMQLTLKSADTTLRLESSLDGFEIVARAAARATSQQGLSLSQSTLENLRALDLPTDHLPAKRRAVNEIQ